MGSVDVGILRLLGRCCTVRTSFVWRKRKKTLPLSQVSCIEPRFYKKPFRLKRKVIDNRIVNEERKQQHLHTPQITFFTRPTSCFCLSLLHCIMTLPKSSFFANINLCIHTLIWLTNIVVTTNNIAITILFFFSSPPHFLQTS